MSKLQELQWQAKMRHSKNEFQQRNRTRKQDAEAWEAKQLRIKLTAEKVNKAIGYVS